MELGRIVVPERFTIEGRALISILDAAVMLLEERSWNPQRQAACAVESLELRLRKEAVASQLAAQARTSEELRYSEAVNAMVAADDRDREGADA